MASATSKITFATDKEADILAITFQSGGVYAGGEMIDAAGVILEYADDDTVLRIEILRYQSRTPALTTFIMALMDMEASGAETFKRDDIARFLNFSRLAASV